MDTTRLEDLFHVLLEIPPGAQRNQAAARLSEGDAELARRALALVAADEKANASNRAAHQIAAAPRTFGNYRTVKLLGSGGMGSVYLAERADGQFQQTVALKILAPHAAGDSFRERFLSERQILAGLSHPNITKLLDGGVTDDGTPYLVLEYVDGQHLDRYCDEHRLNLRERLEMFRKVCEPVAYAHRNLVVHRDLKPSNILVTRDGQPMLLDFGTAKLLGDSDPAITATTPLLTVRYSSPEQRLRAPITTSTDVFSLGVVLYELLTGAWPFGDPSSPEQMLQRFAQETPMTAPDKTVTEQASLARSSNLKALQSSLAGDLTSILRKALNAEPERRYETVQAFSADIENYLNGMPVTAKPAKFVYRAGKFLRRHWIPLAAALVFIFVLLGATVFAERQARIARKEALKAQTTSKFLQDMLATDNAVDKNISLRAMVDRAETKLNRAAIADPLVEADLRLWLAQSFLSRQEFDKSHRELDRAEQLLRAAGQQDDLVKIESWRASGFDSSGDRKSAKQHLEQAIRGCRAPGNHADPEICIESYVNLLTTHAPELTFDQQKQLVREAEEMLKAHPEIDPALHANVLRGESRIALRERRYDDADRVLSGALRIDETRPDPDDNAIAQDLFALADLRFRLGDLAGSAEYHRRRMDLFTRASGPDAAVTQHAAANLAVARAYQGDLREARYLADQAIEKTASAQDYQRLAPIFASALVRNFAGLAHEAEPFARDAVRIGGKTYPKTTSVYADYAAELGISLLLQGRTQEALPILQECDAVYAKLNIPTQPSGNRIHRYFEQASRPR